MTTNYLKYKLTSLFFFSLSLSLSLSRSRSRSLSLAQITVQRDSGLDVTAPKHGKVDPKNAPHVGGNQWAGGTGGSTLWVR